MSGGGETGGRGRVSAEQTELLLTFMEDHVEFAVGKQSVYSRFSASKLWRLLAERLNAAGGAHKSPDKWCRYWADMKYKARRRSATARAAAPGTELSATEQRLRALLAASGRAAGAGTGDGREGSVSGSESGGEAAVAGADELLAEAALRQALAAEKQAEAVTQGVELLRELVSILSQRLPDMASHHSQSLLHHHQM